MGLIIRSSSIHAAGCYTTASIPRGMHVVEYTGPRISKELADEKYENSPTTYLFGIGNGDTVIDGHGTAMFINHSCDPNCETEEIDGRIWIIALRNIPAGAELTYDYQLYDGGDDDAARCTCGAKKCRKTMYSIDELKKRARGNKKSTAKKTAKSKSPLPGKKNVSPKKKSTPAKRRR
jgi:SET domain-containing protein